MSGFSSPIQAALEGALFASTTALLYGLVFSLLAFLRASLRIRRTAPGGTGMLYFATGNSILIASLEISLLLSLLAALFQGTAWGLASWLSAASGAALLGTALGVALAASTGLHLVLWNARGIPHAVLWRSPAAYTFWLGLPSLIFLAMTVLFFKGG
jgi:hypothetical protein